MDATMTPDEGNEVVIWPSFWREYWRYLLPLQVAFWVSVFVLVGMSLLLTGRFSLNGAETGLAVCQLITLLFSAAVGTIAVQCGRVYLSADGIRPPAGAHTRGPMVYPWGEIVGTHPVEKWYGRWLIVTTARKRFFYLPANVADPQRFLEGVEWFVGPAHPLVFGLRKHLRGWA